ncbi:MAG: UDP-glucuronic acid decarboxylase family protein [candidate division WOR-3 bacterium]
MRKRRKAEGGIGVAVVAGGAGFIGSHLCEFLLQRGYRVVCLDNLLTGRLENIAHLTTDNGRRKAGNGGRFEFRRVDITNPRAVKNALKHLKKLDVIFNLASPASPKDYQAFPLETMRVGSEGTRNLLELAREQGVIFIHTSTSEVYGDPKVHPQTEDYWGNVNPVGVRSVYDEAKRFAEALVMTYHRLYKIPVRIARIFNTYGPRMKFDDGRLIPNLIYQALNNQPMTIYGTGRQTRSFCYVSDMVLGLYKLIDCSDPYPINLGNPKEYSVLVCARLIKKLTHSQSRFLFQPLPSDDPKRRQPDIGRAKRLLNWEPKVSLKEGLIATINWFRGEFSK